MSTQSIFERDRDLARERYPEEMERLETLRTGFDWDFRYALRHALDEGHLVSWVSGTHILVYQPGQSLVGLIVRIDTATEHVTDVGMVGKLSCPPLVEAGYERQAARSEKQQAASRPKDDCQEERPPQTKSNRTHYDPYSYWGGIGNYYGDPPEPPPGAIRLQRRPREYAIDLWW
jgi:hypothetical protein